MDSESFKAREKGNRRMNKILMNMYGIFAITTFPWQLIQLVSAFAPRMIQGQILAVYLLAMFYGQVSLHINFFLRFLWFTYKLHSKVDGRGRTNMVFFLIQLT